MEGTLSSVKPFVLSSFDGKCHLLFHLLGFVLQRAAQWAVLVPSGQCPLWSSHFDCLLRCWSGKAFGRHSMWAKWLKIAHYCLLRSTSKWVNGKSFCMEMFMYCVKFPIDFHCLNNVQICWTISAPCNQWHWRPLVAKYAIYESCAFGGIWWSNLQIIQVVASGGRICH